MEAEERLARLLRNDPAPEVRAEAARALSVTRGSAAVDLLVLALEDPDEGVRRVTVLALGRIRDDRAVDAVIGVLETRPELWREAAAALASARGAELVPRLMPLLDSESAQIRQGGARAIAAVSAPAPAAQEPVFEYTDDEGHRHPLF